MLTIRLVLALAQAVTVLRAYTDGQHNVHIVRDGSPTAVVRPERDQTGVEEISLAGDRVAFHTGPLHGERASHCELHDILSGRLVATWNGDLADAKRPDWVKRLSH